ncbi:hypothetical protein JCM8547_000955 [Rhodosporidiobolus lusitaniae]
MSPRPPLHQPAPSRPRSPSFAARPPSPARQSPFSYSPPYQPSQAGPVSSRRGSIGAYAAQNGSYHRRGSSSASSYATSPPTGYYSTPMGQQQVDYFNHAPHSPLGQPAPPARRLSLSSRQPPSSSLYSAPPRPPTQHHQQSRPPSVAATTPREGRRGSVAVPSNDHFMSPPAAAADASSSTDRRRPKTPPDCCSVCGVKETPEWRRGPGGSRSLCNGCGLLAAKRARSSFRHGSQTKLTCFVVSQSKEREASGFSHPSTLDEIERELEGIGAERFKQSSGRYALPNGTRQRILATQERTRRQEVQHQIAQVTRTSRGGRGGAGSGKSAQEKAAAASLMGLRRASVSTESPTAHYASAMAPRSPPSSSRGRRSGSLVGQSYPHYSSNVGSNGSGLPPSSSYMTVSSGAGPSSSFSFGRPSSVYSNGIRLPSPSREPTLPPINPAAVRAPSPVQRSNGGSSNGAFPRSSGLVRPASPGLVRPISALAASTNRMSIAHLTAPREASPPPSRPASIAPPGVVKSDSRAANGTALRRRSASVGPAPSRSSSLSRKASS